MELWDVYDKNREKKGYTICKTNYFKEGEYHLVAHVCVLNSEKQMLIQKRKSNKTNWPSKWDVSAGGAALSGESSYEAAERELFEELSLRVPLKNERPIITVHFDHGFDDYYVIKVNDDTASYITFEKKEIDEIKWASYDDIIKLIENGDFDILRPFIELIFIMADKRGNHYH